MEVIIKPRRTGKTSAVIEKASKDGLYIVCPNRQSVQLIARQAQLMSLDINYPMTIVEFVQGRYVDKNINGFIFDDVDRCLSHLSRAPVVGFSATA